MNLNAQWTDNGVAQTLVYLHGFMGSAADWEQIEARLGTDFNHLRIDLPGHGKSPLDENTDFQRTARQINDLLEERGIQKAHWVGYSMGGRVLLYFALHYPRQVLSLVLESASPGLESRKDREKRKTADVQTAQKLRQDLKAFLADWYRQPLFGYITDNERYAELIQRRLKNDPDRLAKAMINLSVAEQPDLWPRLGEISCPVLLICGGLDQKYVEITRRIQEKQPGFLRRVVPECGHNTHFEQPERFAEILREFIISLITN